MDTILAATPPLSKVVGLDDYEKRVEKSDRNGDFQERWTDASAKNRVSGESGKAMKP